MSSIFNTILFQPLLNILVGFYNTVAFHDLGLSIVFLTIFIRLLLYPLFHKSMRQQRILQALQPKIKDIQKKHADDRVKQTEAMMALYKEHGTNPFSGIGFLLLQLPVLLALYKLFLNGLNPENLAQLYSFVHRPEFLNATFFGLINLNEPSILLVVLAAALQYFQGKLALPKKHPGELSSAEKIGRQMLFIGPVLTLLIFAKLPAAVGLYWVVTSIISIIQQIVVNRDTHGTKLGTIHEGASV